MKTKKWVRGAAALLAAVITAGALPAQAKPGESGSSSVSYTGAATLSASTTSTGASYASTTAGQNALLVSGGTSTLTDATVTKSGDDSSGDNADFYGTNAAVLVYNGATLNLKGGTVTTNGTHANAVFATGTGTVNLEGTTIKTTGNTSGGVMVTGGGTLTAKNLTVETSGNSSAAIRSDRGGGTLTVTGGTYTSHGNGSPAIYSTADITVTGAKLNATTSEGVVIEGKNTVTLDSVTLTDSNVKHNGKSTTYKTIFLYQSMSGDASVGTSQFTAKNSSITGENGDLFYVTNTSAVIDLRGNTLVNNDASGGFLRIEAGGWGTEGKNGGDVTLSLADQKADGDIYVDSISTLAMTMSGGSVYTGAMNQAGSAKSLALTMSADSVWSLTGDSVLTSLSNADSANSNIYLNGHTLTVGGKAVSGNTGTYDGGSQAGEETVGVYTDVKASAWYADAVAYVTENQVMTGTSATTFAPTVQLTRAMMAQILYNMAGRPAADGITAFPDVDSGAWYAKAVDWAKENGVIAGYDNGKFGPSDNITRAQAAVLLANYAALQGEDLSAAEDIAFSDAASVPRWAKAAVAWCVQEGLLSGSDGKISPTNTASRAEIASILQRYLTRDAA